VAVIEYFYIMLLMAKIITWYSILWRWLLLLDTELEGYVVH